MNKNSTTVHGGASGISLLGVAFVILKLTGHITWSWWWVTLPFWGGFALILLMILVFLLVAIIAASK